MQSQPPQIHNPQDSVIIVGPNGPLTINTPVTEPLDFGEGRCPVCPSRAVTLAHPHCPCGFPIREWLNEQVIRIRKYHAFVSLCALLIMCSFFGSAAYFRLQEKSIGMMISSNSKEPFIWMLGFLFVMAVMGATMFLRVRSKVRAIRLPQ